MLLGSDDEDEEGSSSEEEDDGLVQLGRGRQVTIEEITVGGWVSVGSVGGLGLSRPLTAGPGAPGHAGGDHSGRVGSGVAAVKHCLSALELCPATPGRGSAVTSRPRAFLPIALPCLPCPWQDDQPAEPAAGAAKPAAQQAAGKKAEQQANGKKALQFDDEDVEASDDEEDEESSEGEEGGC